jgi:peptidoglycan/LPS O-acetylase OafA/YrhL
MQKRVDNQVCVRRLKARETASISLVKRTRLVLEIGHRELTNSVCRGTVWADRSTVPCYYWPETITRESKETSMQIFKFTASEHSSALKYMKQLDGLRALAVLAVLWTHYLPEEYWLFGIYWGALGVRLFFVLSGFLITGILLKSRQYVSQGKQRSSFALRQFYIRRFLRIFPLYYTTLALAAFMDISPVKETIAWHIPYLSNIYFSIQGKFHGSVGHFWSLSVEEQFYLLWPWLILFLSQRLLLTTIIMLIGIAPLFRLVSTISGVNLVAIWVLTPGSLDTLCLGALLAYLKYHENELRISKKHLLFFFLLTGILMTVVLPILFHVNANSLFVSTLGDTGRGLIFTCLVAAAANGFKGLVGKALESGPIVYLGKISYGIYLIHAFMPEIAHRMVDRFGLSDYGSPLAIAVFSTVATIVVATISWQVLEQPMNDLKRFFQYAPKVPEPRGNANAIWPPGLSPAPTGDADTHRHPPVEEREAPA